MDILKGHGGAMQAGPWRQNTRFHYLSLEYWDQCAKSSTQVSYHNQKETMCSRVSSIVNAPRISGTELAHIENLGKAVVSHTIPSFVGVSVMANSSNLGKQK